MEEIISGIIITIVGMSIVFIGLYVLYLLTLLMPRLINWKKAEKENDKKPKPPVSDELTEEEIAAIAMAFLMYRTHYEVAERFRLTGSYVPPAHRPYTHAGRLEEVQRDANRNFVPGFNRGILFPVKERK